MILGILADPVLRASLARAVSSEEDVVVDAAAVLDALYHGFPRMMVHDAENRRIVERMLDGVDLRVLGLSESELASWDAARRGAKVLRSREDYATDRLRHLLRGERPGPTWVDLVFRDLSRAAGSQLPSPLRGFARRVMEFPGRYHDLHGLNEATGLSRGALKARFRRRELESPSIYLRWFRAMAAAHVLREREVTTLQASHRLGYTSDGNFCRALTSTTGLTPTELRSPQGRQRLLLLFAAKYLGPAALDAWASLDPLFAGRRVA
jgi:AraC-like DNA-binding protein